MEEDVLEMIFEKRGDDDNFKMEDEKLLEHRNRMTITYEQLNTYIKEKVHPNVKEKLQKLLLARNNAISDYYYRENQLFYKNGVADGMNIILSIINLK